MTARHTLYGTPHHRAASLARVLLGALLLLLASVSAARSAASPFGKHFIIAFPDTAWHHAPFGTQPPLGPQTSIVIFSLDTAKVTIKGPAFQRSLVVMPGSMQVVVPSPTLTWTVNAILQDAAFDITADRDIAVYCYYVTAQGSEAFRPMPVESWGSEYYVAGMREQMLTHVQYSNGEEGLSYVRAPGEIMIIASEFTQVHVDYPSSFRARDDNFSLGPGELIVLESFDTLFAFQEFAGTRVTASHPVGVLSGNTRSLGGGVLDQGVEIDSPLLNSAIEWLPPADAWGTKFAYRQVSPADGTKMRESIRVYACSPGATQVRDMRDGTVRTLDQGQVTEFTSSTWINPLVVPFEITTSLPAQAMVVSGPYSEPADPGAIVPYTFNLWGVAMSELTPREGWVNFGRFYAPGYPAILKNYVTIVAEPGATVWLDGAAVSLDATYPRFAYQQAEVAIRPGDHTIMSRGGKFSAIAFGQAQGFEDYRPVTARKKDRPSPQRPHPSSYTDRTVVSYAYPVSGVVTSGVDSLAISIDEGCDSTVAVAVRPSGAWDLVPLVSAALDPGAVNTSATITPIMQFGAIAGYRVRFKPVDPAAVASGKVVIVNEKGRKWEIPYRYEPRGVDVTPNPLDLSSVPANVRQTIMAALKNNHNASVTVRTARLKSGSRGFSLPDLSGLPKLFATGDELKIPVDFSGAQPATVYRDTLIIQTACGDILIPMVARTNDPVVGPDPHLPGYNWRERWLTTRNPCTKSGVGAYEAIISLTNDGGTRFTVASVALVGADADSGFFELGTLPAIHPGDTVGSGGSRPMQILFHPAAERSYACRVRVVTTGGDTVWADLAGIGIESHMEIDDHDFGSFDYTSGVTQTGATELRALPTRTLEVRGLRIVGTNASEFAFDAGFVVPDESVPSTWWRLVSGDRRGIPLVFKPSGAGPRDARIEVIGDFSACDDSAGDLRGASTVAAATAPPVDLGSAAGCSGLSGRVSVHNVGGIVLSLLGVELLDNAGVLALDAATFPIMIAPDSTYSIGVRFTPTAPGAVTGHVRFVLLRADGSNKVDTVETTVTAAARAITAVAHIDRGYRTMPGTPLTIPIVLDDSLDAARVDELVITLPRLTHVSHIDITGGDLAAMLAGTILAGWTATIEPGTADSVRLRLRAPANGFLRGTGALLRLPVGTFLRDSLAGELPFTVATPSRACAGITTRTGRVALDSICGLNLRLIEMTKSSYSLDGNRPNPFNPTTVIGFSIGLDGLASLRVYDVAGREVARLVEGFLTAGRYTVEWEASGHASGVYRYVLRSGDWQDEGVMVLAK